MATNDEKKEKSSEPISYGFVRNSRWWYLGAWAVLLVIVVLRWNKTGY